MLAEANWLTCHRLITSTVTDNKYEDISQPSIWLEFSIHKTVTRMLIVFRQVQHTANTLLVKECNDDFSLTTRWGIQQ